jgi:hypothetical protein
MHFGKRSRRLSSHFRLVYPRVYPAPQRPYSYAVCEILHMQTKRIRIFTLFFSGLTLTRAHLSARDCPILHPEEATRAGCLDLVNRNGFSMTVGCLANPPGMD